MIFSKKNSKSTLKSGDSSRFVLCATTAMRAVTAVHDDDEYYALSSLFFTHRCFMFYVHTLICEKIFGGFHVKETVSRCRKENQQTNARVFCQKTKNAEERRRQKKPTSQRSHLFDRREEEKRTKKTFSCALSRCR